MSEKQPYEIYSERKQKEFYEKYPLCFPNGEPYCGFNCGYGWWPILDKLCADITKELEKIPEDDREFAVAQIKEKFGGLRFYIDWRVRGELDPIYTLVHEAESKCDKICEECGAPGKKQGGGWVKTRCDKCQEEWEEERRRRDLKWGKNKEAAKHNV